jgi:hypothetical protein
MTLESTYVKIVKCKNPDFWYNDKIDQVYKVTSPERKGSPPYTMFASPSRSGSIVVDVALNEFGFGYVDEGDFVFMDKIKLFSRYDILKMENNGNY